MQVELTTSCAGKIRSWRAGEILETPKDISLEEAKRLLSNGDAIPVRDKPVETTSRPRGRPRGRPRKETT